MPENLPSGSSASFASSSSIPTTRRRFLRWGAGLAGAGVVTAAGARAVLELPVFGGSASDDRLHRMAASPNFVDGHFRNLVPVEVTAGTKSKPRAIVDFLLRDKSSLAPSGPLPADDVDFATIPDDSLVWFGHSSFFLRKAGLTIAIDPVFGDASPVPGFGRPFPTTAPFGVDKLPALDLVVITHDHYDHLEYDTITALRDRVARFVCPLGVGMHLERWGVAPARILEADWWESIGVEGVCMTFTPSQHFSGRTFERDTTLWGGWMFEFADYVLYLSGDGGYGPHFREIKKRFPSIDLALLEDGQYNTDWKDIHLMPADWRRALEDLAPRAVFPTHHSKYALSTHGWKEPIEHAQASAAAVGVPLVMPRIGEVVSLARGFAGKAVPSYALASADPWWRDL